MTALSISSFPRWCGAQRSRGSRSALRARSGKGLARRRAEDAWLALHCQHGLPLHVFRLGGAALVFRAGATSMPCLSLDSACTTNSSGMPGASRIVGLPEL